MSGSIRYSPELRERAVRMLIENCSDDPSEWATFTTVAKFFGTSLEAFRLWVRRTQFDTGARSTITSDERARLKQLERERKDLRRANAIVPDASIFFAAAFDGQIKRSLLASTSARVNGGVEPICGDLRFALCTYYDPRSRYTVRAWPVKLEILTIQFRGPLMA